MCIVTYRGRDNWDPLIDLSRLPTACGDKWTNTKRVATQIMSTILPGGATCAAHRAGAGHHTTCRLVGNELWYNAIGCRNGTRTITYCILVVIVPQHVTSSVATCDRVAVLPRSLHGPEHVSSRGGGLL